MEPSSDGEKNESPPPSSFSVNANQSAGPDKNRENLRPASSVAPTIQPIESANSGQDSTRPDQVIQNQAPPADSISHPTPASVYPSPQKGNGNKKPIPGSSQISDPPKLTPSGLKHKSAFDKWKKAFIWLVGTVFIAAVGFYGYQFYLQRDLGPEKTFSTMLNKSLRSSTFTQNYTIESDAFSLDLSARSDFSDPSSPRIDSDLEMTTTIFGKVEINANLRSFDNNVYVRYNSVEIELASADQTIPEDALGSWIQTVQDGKALSSTDSFSLDSISNNLNTIANPIIIGGFNPDQAGSIYEHMTEASIYSFDIGAVQDTDVNGESAYLYEVTAEGEKLQQLYDFISGLPGLENTIDENEVRPQSNSEFRAWISKSSKQLLKVQVTEDGAELNIEYTDYGQRLDIGAPTDSLLSIQDFEEILETGSNDTDSGSSGGSESGVFNDTEIKTDINYVTTQLEVFYANNGYYPKSADDINPQIMPGIEPQYLLSPEGASIGEPDGYQYTPEDCSGDRCSSFVLSGKLSDGSEYTKQSLN